MNYRKATYSDYEALHQVRLAVKENVLVNTHAVTAAHYQEILEQKGCGWLCEDETGNVAGFSIVDMSRLNIWALFLHPDFEGKGIGSRLHELMLNWSFENGAEYLWLSTEPGTRAERFYRNAGWQKTGITPDGETRFEITKQKWLSLQAGVK